VGKCLGSTFWEPGSVYEEIARHNPFSLNFNNFKVLELNYVVLMLK